MLVAFTLFVPENSGLQRFNYLARSLLPEASIQPARGETIPYLVERYGGYGWTGNDLYADYVESNNNTRLRIVQFVPWPDQLRPKLCLLGPEEYSIRNFEAELYCSLGKIRLVIPDKYMNLSWKYLSVQGWSPAVIPLTGQVDKQIRTGEAELAIDIVCTKKTIREEKLSIYDVIFDDAGFVLITKDI